MSNSGDKINEKHRIASSYLRLYLLMIRAGPGALRYRILRCRSPPSPFINGQNDDEW